jgi:hypothetical protein
MTDPKTAGAPGRISLLGLVLLAVTFAQHVWLVRRTRAIAGGDRAGIDRHPCWCRWSPAAGPQGAMHERLCARNIALRKSSSRRQTPRAALRRKGRLTKMRDPRWPRRRSDGCGQGCRAAVGAELGSLLGSFAGTSGCTKPHHRNAAPARRVRTVALSSCVLTSRSEREHRAGNSSPAPP